LGSPSDPKTPHGVQHVATLAYRPYAITAERDLREGVNKLAALYGTPPRDTTTGFGHNLGTVGEIATVAPRGRKLVSR
jgi:hypothetical protein